jgi:hypothetical protein
LNTQDQTYIYEEEENLPEQCSKNSSVTGTSKSRLWSNLKVIESRPERHVTGYSGLTTGGTAMLSGWFQNEYWQNTKLESDRGRPDACLIVTCEKHKANGPHSLHYAHLIPNKQTLWPGSTSELYWLSDRRLLAKLVPQIFWSKCPACTFPMINIPSSRLQVITRLDWGTQFGGSVSGVHQGEILIQTRTVTWLVSCVASSSSRPLSPELSEAASHNLSCGKLPATRLIST